MSFLMKYYITATEELTCHIDDWLLKKLRLEYLIFTSQNCGPKTVDLLLASLGCLSQSSSNGCAARLVGSLLSNFDTFAPKSNKKKTALPGVGGFSWRVNFDPFCPPDWLDFVYTSNSVRSFNFAPISSWECSNGSNFPGSTKKYRVNKVKKITSKSSSKTTPEIVGNLWGPTPWWFVLRPVVVFHEFPCRLCWVSWRRQFGRELTAAVGKEIGYVGRILNDWPLKEYLFSCFNDISWRCFSIPLIFYWCFMMFHRWYFIDAQFLIYMSLICSWHSPCWSPSGLLYVPFFFWAGGVFYKSPNKRGLRRA